MVNMFRVTFAMLLMVGAVALTGCSGSDVSDVQGIVTLDGKPLANATIAFFPTEGRASGGTTDDQGHYSLLYVKGETGALIGEHKVTVSTLAFAEENRTLDYDDKPSTEGKGSPETLPETYHNPAKTTLTATVKSGKNEINFDLTSK